MVSETNRIDAADRTVFGVLSEQKYTVDYFQREYSWSKKHIEQLVSDLTAAFQNAYTPGDERTKIETYNTYYLGPFVVSNQGGTRSIIDGQQRLTSLTLFLIFLNNLQKAIGGSENLDPLIYSEKYGIKSFNIQVDERQECLARLHADGRYQANDNDDASTKNMSDRYEDIEEAFPDELKGTALPFFLDWLRYNVVLVEITAYSDDNAYAIFESMNDRGLNLTSTEMLKGFVLSKFGNTDRNKFDQLWKKSIQHLRAYDKEEDQKFFQAWLRSQYADTIRQSHAGSSNEDFEKIGTRFHSWFRDNQPKLGLLQGSQEEFRKLVETEMSFYLRCYLKIVEAQRQLTPGLEHVYFHHQWGIAESLSFPLMMAPLKSDDDETTVNLKIDSVAQYLENFTVLRSINFKRFGSSSIRYTMNMLVKEIRGHGIIALRKLFDDKIAQMDFTWSGFAEFRLNGQNGKFVKFLLARLTGFIEQQSGAPTNFSTYMSDSGSKPFEIEHIWANKFDEHLDEFTQENDFSGYRNRFGALVLLPRGTNQSFNAMTYVDKVEHYRKVNLWAQSLHEDTYRNNPNFLNMVKSYGLSFRPHKSFMKSDIDERQKLSESICKVIWAKQSVPE